MVYHLGIADGVFNMREKKMKLWIVCFGQIIIILGCAIAFMTDYFFIGSCISGMGCFINLISADIK